MLKNFLHRAILYLGELPKVITAEVEEAEEMMRGDSATNSQMKSCTLKGGGSDQGARAY